MSEVQGCSASKAQGFQGVGQGPMVEGVKVWAEKESWSVPLSELGCAVAETLGL